MTLIDASAIADRPKPSVETRPVLEYQRLSSSYRRLHSDELIRSRTSFFLAAAVVTDVMGKHRPQGTWCTLSCHLEAFNIERADQIRQGKLYRSGSIEVNTADFVHYEQTLVQVWLDQLRSAQIEAYAQMVRDANQSLQRVSVQLITALLHPTFSTALRSVRHSLGGRFDIAIQRHREALGRRIAAIAGLSASERNPRHRQN